MMISGLPSGAAEGGPVSSSQPSLEWKFSQVFGERGIGEEVQEGTTILCPFETFRIFSVRHLHLPQAVDCLSSHVNLFRSTNEDADPPWDFLFSTECYSAGAQIVTDGFEEHAKC